MSFSLRLITDILWLYLRMLVSTLQVSNCHHNFYPPTNQSCSASIVWPIRCSHGIIKHQFPFVGSYLSCYKRTQQTCWFQSNNARLTAEYFLFRARITNCCDWLLPYIWIHHFRYQNEHFNISAHLKLDKINTLLQYWGLPWLHPPRTSYASSWWPWGDLPRHCRGKKTSSPKIERLELFSIKTTRTHFEAKFISFCWSSHCKILSTNSHPVNGGLYTKMTPFIIKRLFCDSYIF